MQHEKQKQKTKKKNKIKKKMEIKIKAWAENSETRESTASLEKGGKCEEEVCASVALENCNTDLRVQFPVAVTLRATKCTATICQTHVLCILCCNKIVVDVKESRKGGRNIIFKILDFFFVFSIVFTRKRAVFDGRFI